MPMKSSSQLLSYRELCVRLLRIPQFFKHVRVLQRHCAASLSGSQVCICQQSSHAKPALPQKATGTHSARSAQEHSPPRRGLGARSSSARAWQGGGRAAAGRPGSGRGARAPPGARWPRRAAPCRAPATRSAPWRAGRGAWGRGQPLQGRAGGGGAEVWRRRGGAGGVGPDRAASAGVAHRPLFPFTNPEPPLSCL